MPVPKGGESVPVGIYLDASPATALDIHLDIESPDPLVLVQPRKLQFITGTLEGYFSIIVQENSETFSSNVLLSISGVNAELFSLKT
jgi:hypothetical protein|mmetsp:Transcript_12910/g.1973  ORF Transcript_12910/g.1973 Transcript_12910/m.1973 type:complete len:87 (-) Transcript_12910:1595-1855(-)